MKKPLVYLSLLLAAITGFAFAPSTATESEAGYMLLVLRTDQVATISPSGVVTDIKIDKHKKGPLAYEAVLVQQLNKLRSEGWTVVQMQNAETAVPNVNFPLLGPIKSTSLTFLLERR